MNNTQVAGACLMRIIWFIQGLMCFIAIWEGVSQIIKVPILDFFIALGVSSIPVVNIILGVMGAVNSWNWAIWQALLLFLAPIIFVVVIGTVMTILERH